MCAGPPHGGWRLPRCDRPLRKQPPSHDPLLIGPASRPRHSPSALAARTRSSSYRPSRALGTDLMRALGSLPDPHSHPCVRKVGSMARQSAGHYRGGRRRSAGTSVATPRGCTTVLRAGEDREARLRELLESVTASHDLTAKNKQTREVKASTPVSIMFDAYRICVGEGGGLRAGVGPE